MAVTDTRSNGWSEPQRRSGEVSPAEAGDRPSRWSDAEAIGGELEAWLEAFTGRRRGDEVLDLSDPSTVRPPRRGNAWREDDHGRPG